MPYCLAGAKGFGGAACHTGLSFAVDARKCHEGAAKDEQVGKGKGQALPVNVGDHDGSRCSTREMLHVESAREVGWVIYRDVDSGDGEIGGFGPDMPAVC